MAEMPRFTDRPFAPLPSSSPSNLVISVDGSIVTELNESDVLGLDKDDFVADFHCVATWSVTGVVWTGVVLRELIASLGIEHDVAPFMVARGRDRRRGHFVTSDAMRSDVILATHLNGKLLDRRHGGPVRLVSPQQYAYKSIKDVVAIDFRHAEPDRLGKEHLRGRVSLQERHPKFPSWLVSTPYRFLIPFVVALAERSLRRSDPTEHSHRP